MFCHKCGTEIIAEDANYCFNCQEPLLKIPAANSQNPSAGPGYLNDEQEDPTDNVNLEFGDDESALRVSDPIDFLMNEEPEDQPPPEPPKPEEPAPMADTPAYEPQNVPFSSPPALENGSDSQQYGEIDQTVPSQPDTMEKPVAPEITDQDQQAPPPDNMEDDSATKDYNIENQSAESEAGVEQEISDSSRIMENDQITENNDIENQPDPEDNNIENHPVAPENTIEGQTPTSVGYTVNEFPPQDNNIENRPVSSERITENRPLESTTDIKSQPTKPIERVEGRTAPAKTTVTPSTAPSFSNAYSPIGGSNQQVATMNKPAVQNKIPPQLNVQMNTDPNQGENIIATSKIKVEEKSKAADRTSAGEPATSRIKDIKTVSDPSSLDLNKIKKSSRIAYLTGNTISFTGGPKLTAGDKITVGNNSYEVRVRPRDKLNLYGLIGSVVVAIIVTLYFLGAFNSSPDGSLVGLVLGPGDRPLADREVRLMESGDKVKTNSAGFFIFDSIPVGIYTVQYIEDGEVIGEDRITVLSGKTSTMKLERLSRIGMAEPMRRPDTDTQQLAVNTEPTPEPPPVKKKNPVL